MPAGVVLALLLIVSMSVVYSGSIWLLTSRQSPVTRRWRRGSVERTVRRETADLDRRIIELTRGVRHLD